MSTTAPAAAIERWLAAGGVCRTRRMRRGVAVDLLTCDGRETVTTITVPDADQDAHLVALLASIDAEQPP